MTHILVRLLLLAIFVPTSVLAIPYSGMYVFGDSLSDAGNVSAATRGAIPGAPYNNGRFTNGPTYADGLAARLGLTNGPSLLPGGADYAFGGARTGSHFLGQQFSILGQVDGYTSATSSADPNALYVVFGGANDIQDAIMASATGGFAAGRNMALTAANNIAIAVTSLATDGAAKFLVPNTPNLARVPRISELGAPGLSFLATSLATLFNNELELRLNGLELSLGIDITRFDTFSILEDVVANPAAYGLNNVTDRCYTGDDLTFTGGGAVCANPGSYLFWDGIHPSASMHRVLADGMFAALSVPEPNILLLVFVGLGVMGYSRLHHA